MTDEKLERSLKAAIEKTAPDHFQSVQRMCDERKGAVIMVPQKKRNPVTTVVAAVAVVAILLGGGFGLGQYHAANAVDAVVALDVNPSIELEVNRKERVISAAALNEEGKAILGDMDLKGSDLDVAVNALIGAMVRAGYIDDLANSILISVEGDEARSLELEKRLSSTVSQLLSGDGSVQAAVLTQTVTKDQSLQAMAEQYGISLGRAQLIDSILKKDATKTFEDLAALTVHELTLLADAKQAESKDLAVTGTASQKAYIGQDKAEAIALQQAGVLRSDTTYVYTHMDWEQGTLVYSVEFLAGNMEYDCDVNALTGAIVDFDKEWEESRYEDLDDHSPATVTAADFIGENAAKEKALAHAGVKASDAQGMRVKLDQDDGHYEYEVNFYVGNTEYDCDIDAVTGAVRSYDVDVDDDRGQSAAPPTTTAPTTQSGYIGTESAKAKALSHAGVTASQAKRMEVELDRDDGVVCYEVSFHVGQVEYDYEIDAESGAVLHYENEIDD